MELGDLISFYRKQAGLTIDELADRADVPKGTLNKIIGGITKAPTLDNMKAIARALGKNLADFDDAPITAKKAPSLSDEALVVAHKYDSLDEHGKDSINAILKVEYDRCAVPKLAIVARGGVTVTPTRVARQDELDRLTAESQAAADEENEQI